MYAVTLILRICNGFRFEKDLEMDADYRRLNSVEILSDDPQRRYQVIKIPPVADIKRLELHTKTVYSK